MEFIIFLLLIATIVLSIKITQKDRIIKELTIFSDKLVDEKNELKRNSDKKLEIERLNNEIGNKEKKLKSLNEEVEIIEMYSLYEPRYNFSNSSQYKGKLEIIRNNQKSMIKNKTAVNYSSEWIVNGSKREGTKLINDNIKMILRTFNAECEAAINKVKSSNIETIENRIFRSYEQLNKLNEINEISITEDFLNLKYEELYLGYEYEQKKEEEREILREEREQEREERRLQQEIEKQKRKIDKEILHYENVIDELEMKLLLASEKEKEKIQEQIDKLKDKIEEFSDEKEMLDYRLDNIGAGYVYIISNIGAFGENVFKIGVTRRLEPLERIRELSNASVPFKFDVHALIFSYQAYELEKELHSIFFDKRVNLINNRKEFFYTSIDKIEKVLEKYKDLTFDFNKIPEAEEYRGTLKLRKQEL